MIKFTKYAHLTSPLYTCRGLSEFYELGHGKRDPTRKPCVIEALASHYVKDIAVGSRHCLALTEKGELFGWGVKVSNEHTTLSTKDCVPLPTILTEASKCGAVYISCGSHEVCTYTCIYIHVCICM